MSLLTAELTQWFGARHKWLQDAARRLLHTGTITQNDIAELVVLCKREAGIPVEGYSDLRAQAVSVQTLSLGHKKVDLRLKSIGEIEGINALAPREPLTFHDEPLTVVYGHTGAGKSGYTRILKHCCGARGQRSLYRNVFQPTVQSQKCKIKFTLDGTEKDLAWTPAVGVCDDLRHLCLFDSDAAQVYVNEENEVTFEPALLSCFRTLVEVSEEIDNILKGEIKNKPSTKAVLPPEHGATAPGTWYNGIASNTKPQDVQDACAWLKDHETQLASVNDRLKEANPAERAKFLRKMKGHVAALKQSLENAELLLGDNVFDALVAARSDAVAKRHVADVDAKKVFENAPLNGVATESWKQLWTQARLFSETEAYPDIQFPNLADDASCVLCQQPLADDAKGRLSAFETFVKGGLESNAAQAEEVMQKAIQAVETAPFEEGLEQKLDLCGIRDEVSRENVRSFTAALGKRRKSILIAARVEELDALPERSAIDTLTALELELEKTAVTFETDAKNDQRPALRKQAAELNARKWVCEQKKSVEDEIVRLNEVALLQAAQRLTNTTALSTKKSSLADDLITSAFIKRFEDEIENLGASRVRVTIEKTRSPKGQVWHRLKIKDNKTAARAIDVLSEGEFRIVSIAAFLADVDVSEGATPFIFDDPISSLDQDFEEATAARLIKLCEKRQVIVFTHRLSLLSMLEDAAKKAGRPVRVVSLQREPWGTGQPGGPPLPAQNPKKALNELSNARLSKAKKVWQEQGTAAYAIEAKALCSDIRITLERLIEYDLMADVIQRFRRPINTMGKIQNLARITRSDCELLDAMMTKYSRYEHAQPREAPVPLPEPDEIGKDLDKLKAWQAEFTVRAIPA